MKILIVNFTYDEDIPNEEKLIEKYYTTTGWAEALQRKGADVIVLNRFHKDSFLEINNVKYYFVKDRFNSRLKFWQVSRKALKKISELSPDIVHVHGFSLTLHIFLLRRLLNKKAAIIIQDHKSVGGKKRFLYNFLNSSADGFFFSSVELGKKWLRIKRQFKKIFPIMEGSSFFNFETRDGDQIYQYHNRAEARKLTNINGSPVFLWVGRLHPHTDPLTVLDGLEILFTYYPSASFYMIHSGEQLFPEVKKKIEASPILKQKVHLLGKIDRNKIKMYYDSSDYFVAGSRYEAGIYALSEALRCGCIPIVTNIPTFKMMTDNGRVGALWKPEDKNSFVETVHIALSKPVEHEAKTCIEFFRNNLSFDAIVETAISHYRKVIDLRLKNKSSITRNGETYI